MFNSLWCLLYCILNNCYIFLLDAAIASSPQWDPGYNLHYTHWWLTVIVNLIAVVADRGGFKLISGLIYIIHCHEFCLRPQMIPNCRTASHRSSLVKACIPNIHDVTFYCLKINFKNIFSLICFHLCLESFFHTGEYPSVSKRDISRIISYESWKMRSDMHLTIMVSHQGDLHDFTTTNHQYVDHRLWPDLFRCHLRA